MPSPPCAALRALLSRWRGCLRRVSMIFLCHGPRLRPTNGERGSEVVDLYAAPPSPDIRRQVIEECANIAAEMTRKHGSPTGDTYTCGVWDQGCRIIGKLQQLLLVPATGGDK